MQLALRRTFFFFFHVLSIKLKIILLTTSGYFFRTVSPFLGFLFRQCHRLVLIMRGTFLLIAYLSAMVALVTLTEGKFISSKKHEEETKDHALDTHEHESHEHESHNHESYNHESGVGEEEGPNDWGSGSGSGSGKNYNKLR